jgi:asparagine synthase (glutamine-hydrolysing)
MVHRGPDGAGTWISSDRRVGLAHRRLSIVDLSQTANQPMSNQDETLWIVYNGEIYNHAEIRAELDRLGGFQWKTDHSDTETILHAFQQWGVDCLHRFNGMFGFALWDSRARELWLVRDRIGIKPLCYSIHDGRVTFASEVKALLKDPDQTRAVDEEALYHYLSFLASPAPRTMFEGIEKVPAGCWVRIKESGEIQSRRYWDCLEHTTDLRGVPEQDICEELMAHLRASVQLQKMSDRQTGVFLSGGTDSSTIAALFAEREGQPMKAMSIGAQGDLQYFENEVHFARMMAERTNAEYHERLLSVDDIAEILPHVLWLHDDVVGDMTSIAIYFACKLARDNGVVVAHVGEGGDELFCGYPHWVEQVKLQRMNAWPIPRQAKQIGLLGMNLLGNSESFPYERLGRAARGEHPFWSGTELFTNAEKQRVLSPRLRKKFEKLTSWEVIRPLREDFESKAADQSSLNWMTYVDTRLRLPELILMRWDRMGMGVSLEARPPFLDHNVIQFVLSIPQSVKIPNDAPRHLHKKAIRGLVPDEIIDRKKQGFGLPLHDWYFGQFGEQCRSVLSEFCTRTDLFDRDEVLRLFDLRTVDAKQQNNWLTRKHSPKQRTRQITALIMLAWWWQQFLQ